MLRYMVIGGYAVNYYGYNRNTDDLDIWLAPTNENRKAFMKTLLCMNYSEGEVAPLHEEDFTKPFVSNIGSEESSIDLLTFVHFSISFDEAESRKNVYEIIPGTFINLTPYDFLLDMKLKSRREKDLWDVANWMK